MSQNPTISFLIPVYNEEENVRNAYEAVRSIADALPGEMSWELLFTDNHSKDRTYPIIREIAASDPRVRGIRFTRNFGFQLSILAGYRHARGDAAIQLDCDLQDPPELIPKFIEEWKKGAAIVYGIRRKRKEGLLLTVFRWVFYRLIDFLSEHPLPHDAGDFRLVDRTAINELVKLKDTKPYLRGTLASMGLPQVGVEYERNARMAGESKFKMKDLFELALDGILSQSTVPLRIATWTGVFVFGFTLILAAGYLVARMFLGVDWPAGFTTLILLLLASISLNSIFLGIIGEYMRRIFDMLRVSNEVVVELDTSVPN